MIQKPSKINKFHYQAEEGPNPYTGVFSFQHFRGEKLYSDIIVKPENHMTETENVECYPVPASVLQNGRAEGYYPDSSMAYIRVLWKEFEPERGIYNYDFIEQILNEARAHQQTVCFRLMAHSTRACDDVPDWLKMMIDCPERPAGKRVKQSPTAPEFLQFFREAIVAIGERFDSDPVLAFFDISLPGAWGEGYQLELYPKEELIRLVDAYTNAFQKTHLMGQLALPELIHYANQTVPVGWRGDGLGNPYHMTDIYPPQIGQLSDNWKKAHVSFESYWWLGEWKRQGWDIDAIIEATLNWHISSFNPKSIPIPEEWQEKIEYWIRKMGYHYQIDSFAFPDKAAAGDELEFILHIDNAGVAPAYDRMPLKVKLDGDKASYEFVTAVDITAWLPGKNSETFTVCLPQHVKHGEYKIELGIQAPIGQVFYFCTDAERTDGFYHVGDIVI